MDSLHNRSVALEDVMPAILQTLEEGRPVRFSPGGISMLPMLRPNRDAVVLSPLPEKLKKYDLPLYRRDNGQYVLHRVVKVGDTYTCMGDHQFYRESGLRYGQMIGVVTEFVRDGKTVSVSHWRYRLYCRLWHHSRWLRRAWRKARRCIAGGSKE